MKTLQTYTLNSLEINDNSRLLKEDSKATAALMNFSYSTRMALNADMPVPDAYQIMTAENSQINYVVNDHHELLGIVSRNWLSSDNLMKYTDKNHGPSFWSVFDLMLPISELPAVDDAQLQDVTVLDVLETFRSIQRDFMLVLDSNGQMRGLLSAEDMIARLEHAPTFRDKGGEVLEILRQLRESHGLEPLQVVNG
ncbi:CBS domain-containing protein [Shewanella sp. A32]|uniref:CBS domain-containing protein n=1 Tax=Shewanella sp. A32 TaxID=3031327 RepID=UPI0023B9D46D|nr:CBS domain-containing protein [Shewanella sp. A32]MDF0533152.1 CBS domain-containing protein [Shewanella sp. A32]